MNPCIPELGAQDVVFYVVERIVLSLDIDKLDVPDGVDVRDAPLYGLYGFYWIMVNDEFDGECVIGIDPEGHLFGFRPIGFWVVCGKQAEILP